MRFGSHGVLRIWTSGYALSVNCSLLLLQLRKEPNKMQLFPNQAKFVNVLSITWWGGYLFQDLHCDN
ncbi:hypothetical protein FOCC_FOCC007508 [Frankliniella occidentalis]|nr:hypothetical protein FOCC_FOCC007508 [Frankliniella occidentalis]